MASTTSGNRGVVALASAYTRRTAQFSYIYCTGNRDFARIPFTERQFQQFVLSEIHADLVHFTDAAEAA
jgi:hypothetical protein